VPEALIGFSLQAGRIDAAEAGHRAAQSAAQKPEPFILYSDFLLTTSRIRGRHRAVPPGAHLAFRRRRHARQDRRHLPDPRHRPLQPPAFASAEREFSQAGKWITDRTSPQASAWRTTEAAAGDPPPLAGVGEAAKRRFGRIASKRVSALAVVVDVDEAGLLHGARRFDHGRIWPPTFIRSA
jgi:hypothetical protein